MPLNLVKTFGSVAVLEAPALPLVGKFSEDKRRNMLSFQKYCRGKLCVRWSPAKMTATNQVSFSLWDRGRGCAAGTSWRARSPLGAYVPQPMAKPGEGGEYSVLRRAKGNTLGNVLETTYFRKEVSEVCSCRHKETALL